jgi:hypothetical protein
MADFISGFLFFTFACVLLCVGGFFLLRRPLEEGGQFWRLFYGVLFLLAKQSLGVVWLFVFGALLSPGAFVAGAAIGLVGLLLGIWFWSERRLPTQTAQSSICLRELRLFWRSSRVQRNMNAKPRLQHMQVVK